MCFSMEQSRKSWKKVVGKQMDARTKRKPIKEKFYLMMIALCYSVDKSDLLSHYSRDSYYQLKCSLNFNNIGCGDVTTQEEIRPPSATSISSLHSGEIMWFFFPFEYEQKWLSHLGKSFEDMGISFSDPLVPFIIWMKTMIWSPFWLESQVMWRCWASITLSQEKLPGSQECPPWTLAGVRNKLLLYLKHCIILDLFVIAVGVTLIHSHYFKIPITRYEIKS